MRHEDTKENGRQAEPGNEAVEFRFYLIALNQGNEAVALRPGAVAYSRPGSASFLVPRLCLGTPSTIPWFSLTTDNCPYVGKTPMSLPFRKAKASSIIWMMSLPLLSAFGFVNIILSSGKASKALKRASTLACGELTPRVTG